jgi:hypothetical protein
MTSFDDKLDALAAAANGIDDAIICTLKQRYAASSSPSSSAMYLRTRHWGAWLAQFCSEHPDYIRVPADSIARVKRELALNSITIRPARPTLIRLALRTLNLRELAPAARRICRIINNEPPIDMTLREYTRMWWRLDWFNAAFMISQATTHAARRTNFMNFSMCAHCFAYADNQSHLLALFPRPKTVAVRMHLYDLITEVYTLLSRVHIAIPPAMYQPSEAAFVREAAVKVERHLPKALATRVIVPYGSFVCHWAPSAEHHALVARFAMDRHLLNRAIVAIVQAYAYAPPTPTPTPTPSN